MDLTAAISNLQMSKSIGQVQVAVAKKLMDTQKMQGAAAVQMIQAASASMNQAGDSVVAAATGLGSSLDIYG